MIANPLQPRSALSGVCLLLATTVVYVMVAPSSTVPVPTVSIPTVAKLPDAPPSFVAASHDSFASIADRPLFEPTRKKYVPPPKPDAEKAAPPIPKIFLVGVIIDTDTRIAMVKTPDAALATALAVGGEIAGWQISAIEPDRILLNAGNSENEIRLDDNKAASPAAPQQHDNGATDQKSSPK
jgi:type II secretory pathway component PulC